MRHRHQNPLEGAIESLFNGSIADFLGRDFVNNIPSANVSEHDDKFLISLAAPGLTKSEFSIKIEDKKLIVAANQPSVNEETLIYKRKEFNFGQFTRSFSLSHNVDVTKITAAYEQGILVITLPKKEVTTNTDSTTIEIL